MPDKNYISRKLIFFGKLWCKNRNIQSKNPWEKIILNEFESCLLLPNTPNRQ